MTQHALPRAKTGGTAMPTKGTTTDVGADTPTSKSKGTVDSLVDNILGPVAPKSTLPKEETTSEDVSEDTATDVKDELSDSESDESSSEESSEDSTEEVVPASKHKKALESMQKRIDRLVSERKALEENKAKPKTQEDKLAQLSEREHEDLIENTTEAIEESLADIRDARRNDPDQAPVLQKRLEELRELRRNAKDSLKNAPKKFQSKQNEHLSAMMNEIKDIDPEVTEGKGALWEIANRVYSRMPSLHTSLTGKAEALAIASEYYLESKKMGDGQEKARDLSKKVTTLKRKTTLDSKTRNANVDHVSSRKLWDKAKHGTYFDKLAAVRTLVPDEFIN